VLVLRPAGASPTESLLETLMVQLAREIPGLDPPTRQLVVCNKHDQFVARVDLCWPQLGLFVELDGQQHLGQPSTTQLGKPPLWPPPVGGAVGSRGRKSCAIDGTPSEG
jgi:hypothetical protein